MIRNNVITVHVTFLFCRNISELYVSIFIVLYPDCIAVVLSKCIQIGHLYIYWNVSGLSVCLSIELYPQCLFVCLTLLRRCILHLSDIIVVFLYWYKYFDLPSSCRDIIFLQFVYVLILLWYMGHCFVLPLLCNNIIVISGSWFLWLNISMQLDNLGGWFFILKHTMIRIAICF